jgi:hypothetical protein
MVNARFFDIITDGDEDMCVLAAKYNRLDCLQHLYNNGYPWNEQTCIMANKCGHLECLKYAYENGCPWNDKMVQFTLENNYFQVFSYMVNKLKNSTIRPSG